MRRIKKEKTTSKNKRSERFEKRERRNEIKWEAGRQGEGKLKDNEVNWQGKR